jgi:hypothetical protein
VLEATSYLSDARKMHHPRTIARKIWKKIWRQHPPGCRLGLGRQSEVSEIRLAPSRSYARLDSCYRAVT